VPDRRASVDNRFGALASRGKRPFCPPPFLLPPAPAQVQSSPSTPSSSRLRLLSFSVAMAAAIETAYACSPLPHCLFPSGGYFPPSPLRRPPSPAMAHRNVASASRSMASRSIEDDFGKGEDNRAHSQVNGEGEPGARVLQMSKKCAGCKCYVLCCPQFFLVSDVVEQP
jgi:hypothetical protein